MSVGRQLAHQLIDTAADLRRYTKLLQEFGEPSASLLGVDTSESARKLEALVPRLLEFEGEGQLALNSGAEVAA